MQGQDAVLMLKLVANLFAPLNPDRVALLHECLLRVDRATAEAAIRQQAKESEFFSIPALYAALKRKPNPERREHEAAEARRRYERILQERQQAEENQRALAREIRRRLGWVHNPSQTTTIQPSA